ncbi:MAG: hypothetical protein PQJ46_00660 [Spirochaetales bacterium]|nr:hypothetical protein [Spirochaetales bacterium]
MKKLWPRKWKANNFVQGTTDYEAGYPVSNDKEIVTLMGATGDRSIYPHRGIDISTVSGTSITPLLWNDQTKVGFANYNNDFLTTEQGRMVGLETPISYMFKGEMRTDIVLQRYLHLDGQRKVRTDSLIGTPNTILGMSGNSGQWNGEGYKSHLHVDISTGITGSPYLDLMASNYQTKIMSSYYYRDRYYYDPLMFLNDDDYEIRDNAWGYNY